MSQLGEKITHRRVELRLSQSELSRLTGVSQTGISKIERGGIVDIRTSTLEKLGAVLGFYVRHEITFVPTQGRFLKVFVPDGDRQ
jgi:transcriptional regulator with XRE-family HTH domain